MTSARFSFADSVRAVLFDAGNTLMWIDHARIAGILSAHGVTADEPSVRLAEMRARPAIDAYLASSRRREGPAAVAESVARVLHEMGTVPSVGVRAEIVADLTSVWPSLWNCPAADAHETLSTLASRGFALGVVSNSNGTVAASLLAAGLGAHLAVIVDSSTEGIEKPDPRLFLRAAERLGASPHHCVYVGDLFAVDVQGARGAGMHAVLLDPVGAWASAVPSQTDRVSGLTELASRL